MNCPSCGEELDDYGPCHCQIDEPKAPSRKPVAWNMRTMVERKLARQAEEKKGPGQPR
jgi:hypothetical protein